MKRARHQSKATVGCVGLNDTVLAPSCSAYIVPIGMMELWASGLNAWKQLVFDGTDEPRNLKVFQRVLKDEDELDVLWTSTSATVGKKASLYLSVILYRESLLLGNTSTGPILHLCWPRRYPCYWSQSRFIS